MANKNTTSMAPYSSSSNLTSSERHTENRSSLHNKFMRTLFNKKAARNFLRKSETYPLSSPFFENLCCFWRPEIDIRIRQLLQIEFEEPLTTPLSKIQFKIALYFLNKKTNTERYWICTQTGPFLSAIVALF